MGNIISVMGNIISVHGAEVLSLSCEGLFCRRARIGVHGKYNIGHGQYNIGTRRGGSFSIL